MTAMRVSRVVLLCECAAALSTPLAGQPSAAVVDSLMERAQQMRDAGAWQQALETYFLVPTAAARLARAETLLEAGEVRRSLALSTALYKDRLFAYRQEALLLRARALIAQGREVRGEALLERLSGLGMGEATYRLARRRYEAGHVAAAGELARRAVDGSMSLLPAHWLLALTQAELGHPYRALLPLTRYLLLTSDEGRTLAGPLFEQVWRLAASTPIRGNAGAAGEHSLDELLEGDMADIARRALRGKQPTLALYAAATDSLCERIRQRGEEALDWWQLRYADQLVELRARRLVEPATHFMLAQTRKPEALAWIDHNPERWGLFAVYLQALAASQ